MGDRWLSGGMAYHVLNLVAAVLVIVGLLICVRGAVFALGEINALYQGVGEDALATPDVGEDERSGRIMAHAVGGVWGLIPLAVGSVLFGVSKALYKAKKVQALYDTALMQD